MRWREGRRSSNVQDRRGMKLPVVGGGIGGIILLVIALLLGNDGGVPNVDPSSGSNPASLSAEERELADFVSVVLADTEDTWNRIFASEGFDYREPTLVLFTNAVDSGCGFAESAIGPFYCPLDERVYIDLSFYRDLRDRFGAPGDFAQAYVIAHEVGHHVQNLQGISEQVQDAQQGLGEADANRLSVMQELQADCYAGIWAHNAEERNILEQGDVEEALNAASSIGDDRLQMQSQGRVIPDSFTHGTSAQRTSWFQTGLESGDVESCNTFEAMIE
ncbi:neutral zinc metallopeptidase [Candidatus Nitrososphaera sp. FF02]|uniref:KPN_02809 family neutral zinc metallopeptidase n=1 Tax=Candidatus Nitrososphaera sp. FF02 TaxID=3398226 RepID=UPI0039EC7811